MNHKKHLAILLQTYLKSCGESLDQKRLFWAYICGWIPEQAASKVFEENGMTVSGNEKSFLHKSYWELRKDKQTEHLEDRKLNEKFSGLVQEVIEDKEKFKNQFNLNNRIKEFLEEIIKPEENYQILFKVHNLNAKIDETKFWDCIIANYDREQLITWGFNHEKNHLIGSEVFENQNIIIVNEKGNNVAEIVKRARVKATRRLRVLQNYLKVEFIYDEQLFFELSKEYAVKRETDSAMVRTGWDAEHSAIKYDYAEFLVEHIGEANKDFLLIQKFPPNLKDLIERTLHWIGLSISEVDPDIKISFLCTALETLLTTKDDKRKGQKIAYRGYLLGMEVNPDNCSTPQQVLRVYDLRSTVVHGSDIGIASRNDYWLLLEHAQATLKHFIEFVSKNKLTRQTRVYRKLLQSEHVTPLLTWLEEMFDDSDSKSISESLKEDQLKIKTERAS